MFRIYLNYRQATFHIYIDYLLLGSFSFPRRTFTPVPLPELLCKFCILGHQKEPRHPIHNRDLGQCQNLRQPQISTNPQQLHFSLLPLRPINRRRLNINLQPVSGVFPFLIPIWSLLIRSKHEIDVIAKRRVFGKRGDQVGLVVFWVEECNGPC